MVSKSKTPNWLSETYPFAQNSHDLPSSIRMNYVDHGKGSQSYFSMEIRAGLFCIVILFSNLAQINLGALPQTT